MTDVVAQSASALAYPQLRVRVFVDFWNYTLSMKDLDPTFQTDWRKVGQELAQNAAECIDKHAIVVYQGMGVYGSYDANKPSDQKLRHFLSNVLDTFPGVESVVVPRQKKRSPPKCPSCHAEVAFCGCGADMRGTEEKGVDTRIVTDMIRLAWEGNYDVCVLVSSDRDFVPVAEFLLTKGVKVIHGAFPPKGFELSKRCWGKIDLAKIRTEFVRLRPSAATGSAGTQQS